MVAEGVAMSRADYGIHPQATGSTKGITLREYYAGLALQGYMANKDRPTYFHPKDDAEWCVKVADALIAELEKS